MAKRARQMHFDEIRDRGRWGGRRERAGRRPRSGGRGVTHGARPDFSGREPAMITWKLVEGIPSLRRRRAVRALREVIRAVRERRGFRVVHYSIQGDHLHLVVEADGRAALSNGLNALGARLARRVSRIFARRGRVFRERYCMRVLRSPREVRHALAYVLNNARKHGALRVPGIDPASSGCFLRHWSRVVRNPRGRPGDPEVVRARSWLLRVGWQRWGKADPAYVPSAGR